MTGTWLRSGTESGLQVCFFYFERKDFLRKDFLRKEERGNQKSTNHQIENQQINKSTNQQIIK